VGEMVNLEQLLFIQGHTELQSTRVWVIWWIHITNQCILVISL